MDTGIIWKEYDGKNMLSVANKLFPEPYLGNHNRTYDSSLGIYLQPDPRGQLLDFSDPDRQVARRTGIEIPTADSLSRINRGYGYVDGDPVGNMDKTGEWLWPIVRKALQEMVQDLATDTEGLAACQELDCWEGDDWDGDGVIDVLDPDDDNDGKPDGLDDMPDDPSNCFQVAPGVYDCPDQSQCVEVKRPKRQQQRPAMKS